MQNSTKINIITFLLCSIAIGFAAKAVQEFNTPLVPSSELSLAAKAELANFEGRMKSSEVSEEASAERYALDSTMVEFELSIINK